MVEVWPVGVVMVGSEDVVWAVGGISAVGVAVVVVADEVEVVVRVGGVDRVGGAALLLV